MKPSHWLVLPAFPCSQSDSVAMQLFLSVLHHFLLVTFSSFSQAIPPPRAEPSIPELPAASLPLSVASARILSNTAGRLVFSSANSSSTSHLHPRAASLLITQAAFPPFNPYPNLRYGMDVLTPDFRAYPGFRYIIRLFSTTAPRKFAYWYHDERTDDYVPHIEWAIDTGGSPRRTFQVPPENAPLETWQTTFTVHRDSSSPPPVDKADGIEGYIRAEYWGLAPRGTLEVWEFDLPTDGATSDGATTNTPSPDSVTTHGQPQNG